MYVVVVVVVVRSLSNNAVCKLLNSTASLIPRIHCLGIRLMNINILYSHTQYRVYHIFISLLSLFYRLHRYMSTSVTQIPNQFTSQIIIVKMLMS